MPNTIDPTEGMRLGIPFRAQKTIRIDEERFEEYPYDFPDESGINLIEAADDIANLQGYYGTAIAEVSSVAESQSGYQYISLKVVRVDIEGKLSVTRQDYSKGMGYESNLNQYGDDQAGPTSTIDKLNRGF